MGEGFERRKFSLQVMEGSAVSSGSAMVAGMVERLRYL